MLYLGVVQTVSYNDSSATKDFQLDHSLSLSEALILFSLNIVDYSISFLLLILSTSTYLEIRSQTKTVFLGKDDFVQRTCVLHVKSFYT